MGAGKQVKVQKKFCELAQLVLSQVPRSTIAAAQASRYSAKEGTQRN